MVTPPASVLVVGQGYVGLPLAMRAVDAGFQVTGYDVDPDRISRLAGAETRAEDVDPDTLRAALASGRYLPTARVEDAAGFDVAVIAVPTPLQDGTPDLSFIEEAGRAVAPLVTPGATVVLESTTYPGTTEELLVPILAVGSG